MLNVAQDSLFLKSELYTELDDKEIYKISLQNGNMKVEITNLGCCISAIYTPDKKGEQKNIVAGFEELKDYKNNRDYFGCVLGRYANRIAGGRFSLEEKEISLSVNDGENHLHGGVAGFNKKIWDVNSLIRDQDWVGVVFEYVSRDGEEGYPGNLSVKVKYFLSHTNRLSIEYHAETDKSTPVNLSNHSYFNLTGFETPLVDNHILQINAISYTENNEHSIPTGEVVPVAGTPLNFFAPKRIGTHIDSFPVDKGFNHNFILEHHQRGAVVLAVQLKDPETGRTLKVYTDQPAIQLYTANFWDGTILGSQGQYYQPHGAVALETQAFPDSPNQPSFPNTILNPGEHYFSTTIYEFGVE